MVQATRARMMQTFMLLDLAIEVTMPQYSFQDLFICAERQTKISKVNKHIRITSESSTNQCQRVQCIFCQ